MIRQTTSGTRTKWKTSGDPIDVVAHMTNTPLRNHRNCGRYSLSMYSMRTSSWSYDCKTQNHIKTYQWHMDRLESSHIHWNWPFLPRKYHSWWIFPAMFVSSRNHHRPEQGSCRGWKSSDQPQVMLWGRLIPGWWSLDLFSCLMASQPTVPSPNVTPPRWSKALCRDY